MKDCIHCNKQIANNSKKCKHCGKSQELKGIKEVKNNKIKKKIFNKEDLKQTLNGIGTIALIICILGIAGYGIYHFVSDEHELWICGNVVGDICGYLTVGFFFWCVVHSMFFEDGFKEGIKNLFRFILVVVAFCFLMSVIGLEGDEDGREPWYDNCSKC